MRCSLISVWVSRSQQATHMSMCLMIPIPHWINTFPFFVEAKNLPYNGCDIFQIAAMSRLLVWVDLIQLGLFEKEAMEGGNGWIMAGEMGGVTPPATPRPRLLGSASLQLCLWDKRFAHTNRSTSFCPGTHFYWLLLINEYIFVNLINFFFRCNFRNENIPTRKCFD